MTPDKQDHSDSYTTRAKRIEIHSKGLGLTKIMKTALHIQELGQCSMNDCRLEEK